MDYFLNTTKGGFCKNFRLSTKSARRNENLFHSYFLSDKCLPYFQGGDFQVIFSSISFNIMAFFTALPCGWLLKNI